MQSGPRRAELARLGRVGRSALAAFGLAPDSIRLLQNEQNATFKVRARGAPFVLRISRAGIQSAETIQSEAAWLSALARDTTTVAPAPVSSPDGRFVVAVDDPELDDVQLCVVFRWIEGRRVRRRLTPGHLAQLGELVATLHRHASAWRPPPGFVRPRVDTLTSPARRASIASSARLPASTRVPAEDDAEAALELVTTLISPEAGAVVRDALDSYGRRPRGSRIDRSSRA